MLLTRDEIPGRVKILKSAAASFRDTSYDVRIGKIIEPLDEPPETGPAKTLPEALDTFVLKPRGVVDVVSLETFQLPRDVTGYAAVKTTLCNDGVLAINTGMIDPGWNGPLSSKLINFSSRAVALQAGDVFLRVTFHHHQEAKAPAPNAAPNAAPENAAEDPAVSYLNAHRQQALRFTRTFLDLPSLTSELTQGVLSNARRIALVYLPLAAFLLAGIVAVTNFGAGWVTKWLPQPTDRIEERIKALEKRLDDAQKEPQGSHSAGAGGSVPDPKAGAPSPGTAAKQGTPAAGKGAGRAGP